MPFFINRTALFLKTYSSSSLFLHLFSLKRNRRLRRQHTFCYTWWPHKAQWHHWNWNKIKSIKQSLNETYLLRGTKYTKKYTDTFQKRRNCLIWTGKPIFLCLVVARPVSLVDDMFVERYVRRWRRRRLICRVDMSERWEGGRERMYKGLSEKTGKVFGERRMKKITMIIDTRRENTDQWDQILEIRLLQHDGWHCGESEKIEKWEWVVIDLRFSLISDLLKSSVHSSLQLCCFLSSSISSLLILSS